MNMLRLIYYPDSILKERAQPVREFGDTIKHLGNAMREIMKANAGMGLAAPQVGDPRQIIIVEFPGDPETNEPPIPFTILVNPTIVKKSKKTSTMAEGCLSVPAVEVPIERADEVTVDAFTFDGSPTTISAKGIYARILQHEIDHLKGRLILDYMPPIDTSKPTAMVWGSTRFTTSVLNELLNGGAVNITHLVTEEPKPSGRGREVTPTIVRIYGDTVSIPVLEPHDLNDERFMSYLSAHRPDVIIVAAYGRLLPSAILDLPKHGCINVHPSLLPLYRGATPLQSAILDGAEKTGVTIMKMAPQFDTGAMLVQSAFPLEGTETFGELETITGEIGGMLINEIIGQYVSGALKGEPQPSTGITYTKKITPQDRWLNMEDDPIINERKVRAFAPEPNAYVLIDEIRTKVLQAHIEDGTLVFDMVQPAGKRPMSWSDFLRGYRGTPNFTRPEPEKGLRN
jgi:methionyl-tRNA formyltransferase